MRNSILAALLVSALLGGCSEPTSVAVSAGRIADVVAQAPTGDVQSLVIYVSDRAGWEDADTGIVNELIANGSAVLPIDLSTYATKLDGDKGACLFVVGELTDLAQHAQRALHLDHYLAPIIVGRGEGATFAYAALADAPANTLGGAVGAGFENRLALRLPFCPGATATSLPQEAGFTYAFDRPLPQEARLLVGPNDLARISTDAARQPRATVIELSSSPLADQIVAAVGAMRGHAANAGLPIVSIKATGTPKGLVVFVSGDGGWRDLDKTMGEWMATQGYDVIGVDALRYFWAEKLPKQFAADLQSIIKTGDPSQKLPVLLVGYSFGADTLPFAWPELPDSLRDRIGLVALLGPSLTTGFQVSVSGWLGMAGGTNEVVPAIAAVPAAKILCVHGVEEKSSACTDPSLAGVPTIQTKGGHHFDGDYVSLGKRVLDAFQARSH